MHPPVSPPAFLAAVLLLATGGRAASIRHSPHDLSASSSKPGAKAVSEDQVCVFCHAPHRPIRNVPLWNHNDTTQSFTFYTSYYTNTYLNIPQPAPAALNGSRTKVCLSCHDGVTALGSAFNVNGSAWANPAANNPNLAMTGAISASANLGTGPGVDPSLADDHPVLYPVSAAQADGEMQVPPVNDPVKVYGAQNLVECTTCHDPHDNGKNPGGKFLVTSNAGAAICRTCHVKTGWNGSAHQASAVPFAPGMGYPATTVGEWACRGCHRMHGAGGTGVSLNWGAAAGAGANPEENTCFRCHGTPPLTAGTGDVRTELLKGFRHPAVAVFGTHRNPEQSGTEYSATPDRRHAECADCHDPHGARIGTRLAKAVPDNVISNALLRAWGVAPTYSGAAWTAPVSWLRVGLDDSSTGFYEYQLCFKCHSSYAYGATPPGGTTDPSIEFNPNNTSTHPVFKRGSNPYCTPTATNGNQVTMLPPWNQAANRHDTMFCSDCHGSDAAGAPEGPHGSAQSTVGGGLLQAGLVATIPAPYANYATPLCIRCHAPAVYANNNGNVLGSRYDHHNNGNHSRAPGDAGSAGYGGCLICHGNLTAGVKGTFHGVNGAWAAGPRNQFMANTTNWTNWSEATMDCWTTGNCNTHGGKGY